MHGLRRAVWVIRRLTDPVLNKVRSRETLSVVGDVLCFSGVFDLHISEFLSVKNLATLQAFDKFRVFLPRDDSHFGMSTGGCHRYSWVLDQMLLWPDCSGVSHKFKRQFIAIRPLFKKFFCLPLIYAHPT
jgi:hypothetical protein